MNSGKGMKNPKQVSESLDQVGSRQTRGVFVLHVPSPGHTKENVEPYITIADSSENYIRGIESVVAMLHRPEIPPHAPDSLLHAHAGFHWWLLCLSPSTSLIDIIRLVKVKPSKGGVRGAVTPRRI